MIKHTLQNYLKIQKCNNCIYQILDLAHHISDFSTENHLIASRIIYTHLLLYHVSNPPFSAYKFYLLHFCFCFFLHPRSKNLCHPESADTKWCYEERTPTRTDNTCKRLHGINLWDAGFAKSNHTCGRILRSQDTWQTF